MPTWVIGAVVNVTGSVLINLGTNLMKLGHNRRQAVEDAGKPARPVRCFAEWQAGISLFAVGNVLNFVSFGFAAQSLLAALGTVQFVSNVVFARFVLGERVTWRVLGATAAIVAGCVLLVSFGSHASDLLRAAQMVRLYGNPAYIAYLVFMFAGVGASYWLYRAGKRAAADAAVPPRVRARWRRSLPVTYAVFSGLLGTQSVLFCKALSTLLRYTFHGKSQLGSWYFWVCLLALALTAVFWVSRLNKGLRLFPATVIVPVMQISWTLFSIVSGMIYFREYRSFTTLSALMFALGVGVVFGGVWLLTPGGGGDGDSVAARGGGGAAGGGGDAAAADAANAAGDKPFALPSPSAPPPPGPSPPPPPPYPLPPPSRRTVSPSGRSTDDASSDVVGASPTASVAAAAAAPPPPDVLGTSPTLSAPWSDVPLGGASPDGRRPGDAARGPRSDGASPPPPADRTGRAGRPRRRTCNSFVADVMHDFSMDARSSVRPLLGLGPPGDMAAVSLFSVPYESRLPTGGGGVLAGSPAAAAVLDGQPTATASSLPVPLPTPASALGAGSIELRPVAGAALEQRWSAPGDVESATPRSATPHPPSPPRPLAPPRRPPDMDALAAAAAAAAARSRLPSRAPRSDGGRSPGAVPRVALPQRDELPPAAAAWAAQAVPGAGAGVPPPPPPARPTTPLPPPPPAKEQQGNKK